MNATIRLLDKYAHACGIKQDKDLAARLRVTKQAVSGWRNERAHPDADSVARMCEATGESVAHWLPLIEAERARNPEARKVWLRLAQMAAAITLTVGVFGPSSAHADAPVSSRNQPTLYIMSNYIWPFAASAIGSFRAARRPTFAALPAELM
ncbi:DUF3693 domain-containing protein [Dyella jiangningensis]